jgi:hypothetical protein
MMKTWRRFWQRSGYERTIALDAAAALLATRAGLRLAGFRRWQNLLTGLTPARMRQMAAGAQDSADGAKTIATMEAAAARHLPFKPNCLEQSLVLWWLLRRRGIPADLRIGVRKDEGNFQAHAWVEAGGAILSESGDEHIHFVPLEGVIHSLGTQAH